MWLRRFNLHAVRRFSTDAATMNSLVLRAHPHGIAANPPRDRSHCLARVDGRRARLAPSQPQAMKRLRRIPAPAAADDAPSKRGLGALVRVNLPLAAGADAPLKLSITRARDRLVQAARDAGDARRPTLVLEIAPAPAAENGGAGSEFEPAYALAPLLSSRELADVKTVAWLPRSIRGHGVLVALACEEMVMAADAEIGDAAADEPADQGGAERHGDRRLPRNRRQPPHSCPTALAESMIDPTVEVVQVESEEGLRFLLRSEVEEFRRDHEVISESVLVPAGSPGAVHGQRRPAVRLREILGGRQAGPVAGAGRAGGIARGDAVAAGRVASDHAGDCTARSRPRTASQIQDAADEPRRQRAPTGWACGSTASAAIWRRASTWRRRSRSSIPTPCAPWRTCPWKRAAGRRSSRWRATSWSCTRTRRSASARSSPPAGGNRRRATTATCRRWRNAAASARSRAAARRGGRPSRGDRQHSRLAGAARRTAAGRCWRRCSIPGSKSPRYRNKATGEERLMSAEEAAALADAVNWTRGAALARPTSRWPFAAPKPPSWASPGRRSTTSTSSSGCTASSDIETVEPNWALEAGAGAGLAGAGHVPAVSGLHRHVHRAEDAGRRRRRRRGGGGVSLVLLEQVPRGHGRVAGNRHVRRPASC